MVVGGRIKVTVRDGGRTWNLSKAVAVTPRSWPDDPPRVPLGSSGHDALAAAPRGGLPLSVLGRTVYSFNHPGVWAQNIGLGPNRGYHFVVNSPFESYTVLAFLNDALMDVTHPLRRAHDPALRGAPLPAGRVNITALLNDVQAHEGITLPVPGAPPGYKSHWQRAVDLIDLRTTGIRQHFERQLAHDSDMSLSQFRAHLNRMVQIYTGFIRMATRRHPVPTFLPLTIFYHYPYIEPRFLRLAAQDPAQRVDVANHGQGAVSWRSGDEAIARVVPAPNGALVTPVAAGRTTIRVENDVGGDWDEIPVIVN